MSKNFGLKLKAIRVAEGLTQREMAVRTGISLGTLKNYEAGADQAGLTCINRVLDIEAFQKYTLWLMIGKTCELAGQIAPALSHSGREKTE